MSRGYPTGLVFVLALGLAPLAARGEGIAFVHEASIYLDAKEAPLKAPEGVACTDKGYVVVADTGNHRLLTFTFKDGRVAGGAEVKLAQLVSPFRVQIDSKGDVLALDSKTRRIVRVAANGSFGGAIDPPKVPGGAAVVVGAFKLDTSDNLYLLDIVGRRVLVLDSSGKVTAQVALPKESGTVTDIAVDASGTLYAVDAVGAAVWSAEKGGKTFKPLTPSLKDRMSFPTYLTATKGRLFVVDQNGNGVVILGLDGSYQGRHLSIGWGDGLVNYPAQVCLTSDGLAFVADRFNNRVQVFSTGGK